MTMPAAAPASPTFWRSGRGRFLAAIALAAVLLSLLAVLTVLRDESRTARRFAPVLLFPELEARLPDVAKIELATREGRLTVERAADDRWVVPEANSYPASAGQVRGILLGLSEIKAVERKTARPDWHAALELGVPEAGGGATRLALRDAAGEPLALLLVGKVKLGGLAGKDAFYVRREGEDQTYLAEGVLPLEPELKSWLDTTIVDIGRDRVRRVAVTPPEGPPFVISRASAEEPNFMLDSVPAGREMMSETAANAIGAGVVGVTLEAVQPQSTIDFTRAARIVYETFDGLTLAIDTVAAAADQEGEAEAWMRLSATGAPGTEAVAEADQINARVGAWAYALSSWKAALFRRSRDSLLKAVDAEPVPSPTVP